MSEADAWGAGASEITLKELNTICKSLVDKREAKEALSQSLKEASEEVSALEYKILGIMKENALPTFKGEFGSISIKHNRSVSQPENFEEKLKFFGYLKEQGIFEEMVAVNSRTLSSWASKEIEEREKKGVFGWVPPGLKAPTEHQSLSLRKK